MNLQNQIETIKKEVGTPRKDRGLKVKAAAIRFEEHFRDKIFTGNEFQNWIASDAELAQIQNDPNAVRRALQQAGTRNDLPRPFEIVRMGKSSWAIHPPENYFLKGRYPKEMIEFLQKTNRRIKKFLQSINWDTMTTLQRLTFATQYRYYKNGQEHMMLTMSDMQLALDNMSEEFLGITPVALLSDSNDSDQAQP